MTLTVTVDDLSRHLERCEGELHKFEEELREKGQLKTPANVKASAPPSDPSGAGGSDLGASGVSISDGGVDSGVSGTAAGLVGGFFTGDGDSPSESVASGGRPSSSSSSGGGVRDAALAAACLAMSREGILLLRGDDLARILAFARLTTARFASYWGPIPTRTL